MIDFYGAPMSSAGRTHWMLEEVGVPYAYHRVDLRDPQAKQAYRQVNPGGKVPFLVDGGLRLAESMAINFYLAEKYAPALLPSDVAQRAQAYQWSSWAITNLQPAALQIMAHMMWLPEAERSPKAIEQNKAEGARLLEVLEGSLDGEFLVGGRFSVADVNAASVVNLALSVGIPAGPRVTSWMERLRARPGYQAAAKNA